MTGTIVGNLSPIIKNSGTSGVNSICGGTTWNTGAYLELYGKDESSRGGNFLLGTHNGTSGYVLQGTTSGELTWNGTILYPLKSVRYTGLTCTNCNKTGIVGAVGSLSVTLSSYNIVPVAIGGLRYGSGAGSTWGAGMATTCIKHIHFNNYSNVLTVYTDGDANMLGYTNCAFTLFYIDYSG